MVRAEDFGVDAVQYTVIAELEKKVGIDFFVNLPGRIGKKEAADLEARDPVSSSVWRLNQ